MGLHRLNLCCSGVNYGILQSGWLGYVSDQSIWNLEVQYQLPRGFEDQQHCQQKFRANAAPPDSQKHAI